MEQRFDVRFGSWSCENSSARRALRNISTAWGKESSMLRGMIISIWIDSFEFANHLGSQAELHDARERFTNSTRVLGGPLRQEARVDQQIR
jgi:hypothetical protein